MFWSGSIRADCCMNSGSTLLWVSVSVSHRKIYVIIVFSGTKCSHNFSSNAWRLVCQWLSKEYFSGFLHSEICPVFYLLGGKYKIRLLPFLLFSVLHKNMSTSVIF